MPDSAALWLAGIFGSGMLACLVAIVNFALRDRKQTGTVTSWAEERSGVLERLRRVEHDLEKLEERIEECEP